MLTERQKDRFVAAAIRTGGILVILVVAAIVVNIGLEALPLFKSASAGALESLGDRPGALVAGTDQRHEIVWTLDRDGVVRLDDGRELLAIVDRESVVIAADHEVHGLVSALTDDGRVVVGSVRFSDSWTDDRRETTARWRPAADPLHLPDGGGWVGVTANAGADGDLVAAAWSASGELTVARWDADDEIWRSLPTPAAESGFAAAAVAEELATLAVVDGGRLRIFDLPGLTEVELETGPAPTTALRFLIGGGTLVASTAGGEVALLLRVPMVRVTSSSASPLRVAGTEVPPGASVVVPDDEVGHRLAERTDVVLAPEPPIWKVVRTLPPMPSAARLIAPEHRRRGFLIGGVDGTVALYYSTSGRRLLTDRWSEAPIDAIALAPKDDGAIVLAGGELRRRTLDNPHPEISLRTLFLPVFYEGYAAPKWVWQTTGGSDAFEPKMSLWPLIFGTLKATLYALLFSIPVALMAAVYVSQLAPPWLQAVVKPTVELMAAVPSVVVGFVAALWLAPRLEAALFTALLAGLCLPLSVAVALVLWRALPIRIRRRAGAGSELAVLGIGLATLVGLVALLANPLEQILFGGDFQRALFTEWGLRYDQRNSLVVGLALGFAVIPVIFTIAEDACSAVPRSLISASRALGATRWQTAVRLVVPAASPGLFAGVMLGLGRAVGETMIVLMAAGNTPILDLSPFNGMRTMSAAIAVEIPEAPVGGTLFRVLFLTGALLFVFTFLVTTAADVVGNHLRKRYARF
ncbi:MAG: ABC transporter permease subunit [Thermoanaerobaculales bacterium]|nr:ABC transporter permease subunit [Thermoanaerobaculales bacterium]